MNAWAACLAAGPQPDKWESAIARFEEQDREAPPPEGEVLFAGSSSMVRWNLKESFPGKTYINRGFGGSQIADSTRYAERIITPCKPRLVVLYAGDNDLAGGKSPEQIAADFKAFVAAMRSKAPETRVVFISIKPSLARWKIVDRVREANRLIADEAKAQSGIVFLDVFTPMLGEDRQPRAELFVKDGLHLSPEGYALWTRLLTPLLEDKASAIPPGKEGATSSPRP